MKFVREFSIGSHFHIFAPLSLITFLVVEPPKDNNNEESAFPGGEINVTDICWSANYLADYYIHHNLCFFKSEPSANY